MPWTLERIELLKKLVSDGQSASQIAATLGDLTRNAVCGKCDRLGLQLLDSRGYYPRAQEPVSEPDMLRVTYAELKKGMCNWLLDAGKYCGCPTPHRLMYCEYHIQHLIKRNELPCTPPR